MSASIPHEKPLHNGADDSHLSSTQAISEMELLSLRCEADAAKFLGASPRTLQAWRVAGNGPRYVKSGRSVRYRLKDLIAYSDSRARCHTSQKGGAE